MKQLLFLLFALFFTFSNAQDHLLFKGSIKKTGITNYALRTAGNTVLVLDSIYYVGKRGPEGGVGRTKYEYTDFGVMSILESGYNNSWSKNRKLLIFINKLEKADSSLIFVKDFGVSNGNWENVVEEKNVYEYDDLGNEIKRIEYRNLSSDSSNQTVIEYLYYYSVSQLDSAVVSTTNGNNEWVDKYENHFRYSSDGLLISNTKCRKDEFGNPFFENCFNSYFYYNEQSLVDSIVDWNGDVKSRKREFFYDGKGNNTLELLYIWSKELNVWKLDKKEEYTYDYNYTSNLILFSEGFFPNSIYSEDPFTKGIKNLPLTHSRYFSNGINEELEYQSTYYYYFSEKTVTALPIEEATSTNFYPNPASSTLQVSEEVLKTNILDLYGKSLLISKTETVDVSSLPNGSYMLLLETDKGVIAEKLLISK